MQVFAYTACNACQMFLMCARCDRHAKRLPNPPDHQSRCMDCGCHVCQLELSVLESANRLSKLLTTLHVLRGYIRAELRTSNTVTQDVMSSHDTVNHIGERSKTLHLQLAMLMRPPFTTGKQDVRDRCHFALHGDADTDAPT